MSAFCRDCLAIAADTDQRCAKCGSPRLKRHKELFELSIAHVDCDAFYASVEKRDNPDLKDKPVVIGGGRRGVASTCCYVARLYGVRSAMPMFQVKKLCPSAVIVPPDMAKYARVSRQVQALMAELTPLVEPLSLDEAFLDLSGTERLHGKPPAITAAEFAAKVEREIGITISVGLSYCKFLAKLASDLEKPRGFAVIGRAEAVEFLSPRKVGDIWGVGKALAGELARDGITTIGQLQGRDEMELIARYGSIGRRLARFAMGQDNRKVDPEGETKSISAETTFETDLADFDEMRTVLWRLCEKVAKRLKRSGLSGRTVTLKLKSSTFKLRTRAATLSDPTILAEVIFQAATPLLKKECGHDAFRLIGIGVSNFGDLEHADPVTLADPDLGRHRQVEQAMDKVREKFGDRMIGKGRGLRKSGPVSSPSGEEAEEG